MKTTTRALLFTGALAASTGLTSPAQAFGPTCIPTLYNCMCTFVMPCPVTDPSSFVQQQISGANLTETLQVMQTIKDPQQAIMMALRGEGAISIPGIDSIGIDINGLVNGDLTSLGLQGEAGSLIQQLDDVGINGNTLVSLSKGELGVDDFVRIAANAGLNDATLAQIGLPVDTIVSLANGDLSTSQILDVAMKVGAHAGVLNDVGITQDLISGVAEGTIQPSRLLQIAQEAGLQPQQLASLGLDSASLANLHGAGSAAAASFLQQNGFDRSAVTNLGLDAGLISQISSGQLSADAINDLVAGTGIDPSSITLPGVDGPISLANLQSNIPSSDDILTIPANAVPGLQGALDAAAGNAASSGTFTGPDALSGAMCAGDVSLISVGVEPNGYGDDVENINMAISGGSVETFPEAKDEANTVAASTMAHGLARSMQIRPILAKAVEGVDTFDTMIEEAQTLQDDFIVNDTIRTHLMTVRAETASLLTSLLSVEAADRLTVGHALSPLPLFPNEGRYRDLVKNAERDAAKEPARQASIEAKNYSKASAEYSELQSTARDAIFNYNLYQDALTIASGLPGVEEAIDRHETQKSFLYSLENMIKSRLATLYGGTANQAWSLLSTQLAGSAGSYINGNKWDNGYSTSRSLSLALTAQVASTAYGSRVQLTAGTSEDEPTYTTVPMTPSSYGSIDSYAASEDDPYRTRNVLNMVTGDDQLPGGLEMANLLQYYLETYRREAWTAVTRRGDAQRTMTGAFWSEMIHHAPECLTGPIPTSVAAITARPDMFDLSKHCDHYVWSYGDPGDYISANELGGADAALWLSKINIEKINTRTGGAEQVMAGLQEAQSDIQSTGATTILAMMGYSSPADHIDAISAQIGYALREGDFSAVIEYPSRPGT